MSVFTEFVEISREKNGAPLLKYLRSKGQLISKCIFCVSNSPKKRT